MNVKERLRKTRPAGKQNRNGAPFQFARSIQKETP
jgi:hypothetical protein